MDAFTRTIPRILESLDTHTEARKAFVFAAWRTVGSTLDDNSEPIEFEDGRLVVAIANKTWQRNLKDLSGQFLFRLNSMLGGSIVRFIEFRVDPGFAKQRRPVNARNAVENTDLSQLPEAIRDRAAEIADGKLRATFLQAAANCLSRSPARDT